MIVSCITCLLSINIPTTSKPSILITSEDPVCVHEYCEYEGHRDNSIVPDASFRIFMEEIQNQVNTFVGGGDSSRRYAFVTDQMLG